MNITKNIENQNIILNLKGRLDTVTSPLLEQEVNNIDFDSINILTLNMNDLEYISSAGLRVILALYKKMKTVNCDLQIVNVTNPVMEIFSMTGMADFLDIKTI